MATTWFLHDLKTGAKVEELPLRPSGTIERTVGKASSLSLSLDVHDARCPANWVELMDPRRAMIVVVEDGVPLQGYVIAGDSAGEPTATWNVSSLEGVLDRINVRTHDFYEGEHDEAFVAQTLLADVIGPDFGFDIDAVATGKSADHSYTYEEDRSVGSALNDLASAEGGPEWTIRLTWADSERQQRIIKTIHVGPKIGVDATSVVFENVHLKSRTRNRSAARDDMAVRVQAVSDGSGPDRPMSEVFVDQDAIDAGVPPWEARVRVGAIDEVAQLNRIALAGLSRRRFGVRTWEMELALTMEGCPRIGHDFDAGDTVTIQTDPTFDDPASWHGTARVIGWRANVDADGNLSTVTPVFWEQPEEGTQS